MSLQINNAYQIKQNQISDIIKDLYFIKQKLFNITVEELKKEGFKNEQEVNDFFKDYTTDWGWMKCSVMIYFYKGKIIIQFFNSLQSLDLTKELVKRYNMKDYSYENRTDGEKVKNWKEQETFWKEFSNDFGNSFRDKGFTYTLIGNEDITQLKLKSKIMYFEKISRFPKTSKFSFKSVLRDFFQNLYSKYGN